MKKPISYFLGEGVLIVFSILLALGVNEWRVRSGEHAEEKKAVADIAEELRENKALLDDIPGYHRSIGQSLFETVGTLEEGDTRTPLDIFLSTEGLRSTIIIQRWPQDVSWQVAKDRGVVGRFDYDTAKMLSITYDSQLKSVLSLFDKISELLSRPEMFSARDQGSVLSPLAATFLELAAREEMLLDLMDKTVSDLGEEYPKIVKQQD